MTTQNTPLRRKDRAIPLEEARRIIKDSPFGIFITADQDGFPYGVPVSHVLEDNHLYFHCALSGRKLENMKKNPHVSMTFVSSFQLDQEAFTTRYESAIAEGSASMITDENEKRHALSLICKQYAPDSFKDSADYIEPKLDITGVCRMEISQICGKINKKTES